jgi:hypothetical protein
MKRSEAIGGGGEVWTHQRGEDKDGEVYKKGILSYTLREQEYKNVIF